MLLFLLKVGQERGERAGKRKRVKQTSYISYLKTFEGLGVGVHEKVEKKDWADLNPF